MTPPEAPVQGHDGPVTATPPAVCVRLDILAKRADFLRAAQARRQGTPGFLLQARQRQDQQGDPPLIRVGFTCSKKVGNSVIRNRARRRLREIARAILPGTGRPGWDYVLVGRPDTTISRDFAQMRADLIRALGQVHEPPKARS
ncbi:MAG TPA: ribonuclease P protein component [Paracoccaceae bacterium]|nr:ribonuclease P protein component [Paracoccaceae bacterium]